MELDGRLTVPEMYKLVEVALVAVKLEMVVLPRLVVPDIYRFVEVAFTKIALVEVAAVPEALVKYSGPVNVPPASGK